MKISPDTVNTLVAAGTLIGLGASVMYLRSIAMTNRVIASDLMHIGSMLDDHITESKHRYDQFIGVAD